MLLSLIFCVEDWISIIVYLLISFYLFVFLKFEIYQNGNLEFETFALG
jgi:hypothetical protein